MVYAELHPMVYAELERVARTYGDTVKQRLNPPVNLKMIASSDVQEGDMIFDAVALGVLYINGAHQPLHKLHGCRADRYRCFARAQSRAASRERQQ
jgi:hypothetical protein